MTVIYVASPLSTYLDEKGYYTKKIEEVHQHFPGAEILPARDLFKDNDDWRERWPSILARLDVLVFFSNRQDWIGAGVYREVADCLAAKKKVFYLTRGGDLLPRRLVLIKRRGEDPSRFAEVIIKETFL